MKKYSDYVRNHFFVDGFFLRFGENCRLPFRHIPVKLIKNEEGVLEGTYSCEEKEFPGM